METEQSTVRVYINRQLSKIGCCKAISWVSWSLAITCLHKIWLLCSIFLWTTNTNRSCVVFINCCFQLVKNTCCRQQLSFSNKLIRSNIAFWFSLLQLMSLMTVDFTIFPFTKWEYFIVLKHCFLRWIIIWNKLKSTLLYSLLVIYCTEPTMYILKWISTTLIGLS